MHARKWSALVGASLIAVAAQAGREIGDYRGLPKDLAAAATAYDLAQFRSNRPELDRLLAADYVLVGTGGRTQTKVQSMADAAAPAGKNKTVVISRQIKRAWPNGAVLAGVVEASEVRDGKRTAMKARFADVWAKRQGRWQVIFTQIDPVR